MFPTFYLLLCILLTFSNSLVLGKIKCMQGSPSQQSSCRSNTEPSSPDTSAQLTEQQDDILSDAPSAHAFLAAMASNTCTTSDDESGCESSSDNNYYTSTSDESGSDTSTTDEESSDDPVALYERQLRMQAHLSSQQRRQNAYERKLQNQAFWDTQKLLVYEKHLQNASASTPNDADFEFRFSSDDEQDEQQHVLLQLMRGNRARQIVAIGQIAPSEGTIFIVMPISRSLGLARSLDSLTQRLGLIAAPFTQLPSTVPEYKRYVPIEPRKKSIPKYRPQKPQPKVTYKHQPQQPTKSQQWRNQRTPAIRSVKMRIKDR